MACLTVLFPQEACCTCCSIASPSMKNLFFSIDSTIDVEFIVNKENGKWYYEGARYTVTEKNLTTGSVFKKILFFSLPYLFSYFLQTLYGMADLFIIGQFESVSSTTAVSIGSQVMHMLTVMIVGLAMGATVSIGQAVGASDKKKVSAYTGNTVTLFMGLSVFLAAVLLLLRHSIVSVMSTPSSAVAGTGSSAAPITW